MSRPLYEISEQNDTDLREDGCEAAQDQGAKEVICVGGGRDERREVAVRRVRREDEKAEHRSATTWGGALPLCTATINHADKISTSTARCLVLTSTTPSHSDMDFQLDCIWPGLVENLANCTAFCSTPETALSPDSYYLCILLAQELVPGAHSEAWLDSAFNNSQRETTVWAISNTFDSCMTEYCSQPNPNIGGCQYQNGSATNTSSSAGGLGSGMIAYYSTTGSVSICDSVNGAVNPDIGGIGVGLLRYSIDSQR